MGQNVIELKTLTPENIWELDEEDVFNLVTRLQTEPGIIQRQRYYKIIEQAFDFRMISKSHRDKQSELAGYGFKFFNFNGASPVVAGIYKRKRTPVH